MKWLSVRFSWSHEKQRKQCWHLWFAWYPVIVFTYPDGANLWVWLRTVERKGEINRNPGGATWTYQHRERKKDERTG